ncbi:MAG TPA: hypothetical protein PLI18_14650, partial [Pirellulaceae bacterium]|nr:hypothetical protein [Pirellulaceae bacterium]
MEEAEVARAIAPARRDVVSRERAVIDRRNLASRSRAAAKDAVRSRVAASLVLPSRAVKGAVPKGNGARDVPRGARRRVDDVVAAEAAEAYERQAGGVLDFLNRIYYDLRNLGLTAEDRALNYAATNAFQVAEVIGGTSRAELDLDRIIVKKSPVCRPDSDCYDVELAFFDPNNTQRASRIHRFTVDVSDVL